MIGRRGLLLVGTLAVAGCTVGEQVQWLPWSSPSPIAVAAAPRLPEQLARASALAEHLIGHARAWKLSQRRVTDLGWFVAALDEHRQVLLSSDPARRQRTTTPLPAVPEPTQQTAAATQAALDRLLSLLRAEHRTRALGADGQAALLWTGLAAFSGTMSARLGAGLGTLGEDGTDLTPDPMGTGDDRVAAFCLQAAYGYEMALAFRSLGKADQRAYQARLLAWRRLRDALLALAPQQASAPPVAYDVRPAGSAAAARALATRTEGAALPLLGAWLAGTDQAAQRRLGIDELARANTALVGFGGPTLRWPGWPG